MKILVVGDGGSNIHEVAVAKAFRQLGHEVEEFYWNNYFKSNNKLIAILKRIQNKFLIGPIIFKVNDELIKNSLVFEPDIIFIYRGTHITNKTIIKLKFLLNNIVIFGYNNDDPFSKKNNFWEHRFFIKSIPEYDLVFAYRKRNIREYLSCGAKNVELLMPWFLQEHETDRKKIGQDFKYDVVFVGHYEPDERISFLKEIADSLLVTGLFGPDWDRAPKLEWLNKYKPIFPLRGKAYIETITSAKVALCFLSTMNGDAYTRRCFEIPAMGVFMLCQYSEDLTSLFRDGIDAVFFTNPEDMMKKLHFYLKNDELRNQIAISGRKRVLEGGHDVLSRMKFVLSALHKLK